MKYIAENKESVLSFLDFLFGIFKALFKMGESNDAQ